MPVWSRACVTAFTEESGTGFDAVRFAGAAAAAPLVSSLSVFHAPQPGHWPSQRGASAPQEEQTKTVVARGMH
jgi:hypothetical protein